MRFRSIDRLRALRCSSLSRTLAHARSLNRRRCPETRPVPLLPGVTVETTSPSLIEKSRSVVTDDTGRYRSSTCVPALYAVTFALTGFSTVQREGIELGRIVSPQP